MTNNTKIALITGSTSGIGKMTAMHMAKMGMQLVLPVRNITKGTALKEELIQKTGNDKIELISCHLDSLDSVRQCAETFMSKFDRLDLLINNAGVWYSKRELSKDGFEMNFAVNHLSHFLLTNLLLDHLKKSEGARIVSVSSSAHNFTNMQFDDLQSEKSFNSFKAYGQSKLANILFIKKLASLLADTNITANCVHPGVEATNLFDSMGGFMKQIFKMIMITPEKGASTSIYLATSDDVKGISGQYFKKKKKATSSAASMNKESAEKLWDISLNLTKLG